MDPKNQENSLKKYDEKSLDKLQSRVIFTDPAYLFIFKKTEKVVAAIYLITNLISDIEPIKWQIRKVSAGLVTDMLVLKKTSAVQSKQIIIGLTMAISEIISLLKIAAIADHISSMNHSVVQKELVLLMDSLQGIHFEMVGGGALILAQDFFNVSMPVSSQPLPTNYPATQAFHSKGQYRTSVGIKDNQTQQVSKDNQKNVKDSRRDRIIQLLKGGKPSGIKDFAREIKDCSEKTLQRELLGMVESGVLKKTGERRWSLYSLV